MAGRKKSVLNSELTGTEVVEDPKVIDVEAKLIEENHQMTTDEILDAQQKNTKSANTEEAASNTVNAENIDVAKLLDQINVIVANAIKEYVKSANSNNATAAQEATTASVESDPKVLENSVNGFQKFFNPKPDRMAYSKEGKKYLPDEQIVENIHKNYESVDKDVVAALFAIEKNYVFNIRYQEYAMAEKDVMWYAVYNTNVLLEKMVKVHKKEEKIVERKAKHLIRSEERSKRRQEAQNSYRENIKDLLDRLEKHVGEVNNNATEAGFDMGGNPATA